jgi:hypothetical protein
MNDKSAKLIRKYASRTSEDHGAVLRRWMGMTAEEKRRFRQKMKAAIAAEK